MFYRNNKFKYSFNYCNKIMFGIGKKRFISFIKDNIVGFKNQLKHAS